MNPTGFVQHCLDLLANAEEDVVALVLPRELFPEDKHHTYFGCIVAGIKVIPHDGSMTMFWTMEDMETFRLFEHQQRAWGAAMHYFDYFTSELEKKARKGYVG